VNLTGFWFVYSVHNMNAKNDKDEEATLALMEVINKESAVSQRKLANHMGVALGLANSYMKRCVRKGWIKINDAPANRYLYYLTPKGFAEKSRLTAKYLSNSLQFYRKARQSCSDLYDHCHENGWKDILLCGVSDLTEIAILQAMETEIEVVGIYQRECRQKKLLGKVIWNDFSQIDGHDVCIVTDLDHPVELYQHVVDLKGDGKVLVPDILDINIAKTVKKH